MIDLYRDINKLLKTKRFWKLYELMEKNRDNIVCSNELSFFYYLCQINKDLFEKEDYEGLLKIGSIEDILLVFFHFRRIIQRVAYCEEFDSKEVLRFMKNYGINVQELLWTVNSSVINPEETLSKIRGIHSNNLTNNVYNPRYEYKDIKLSFIICSNDINELEETKYFINRLYVPEGITVEVIEVRNAASICAGYNEGMQSTSAQFKVYMHQDVRILDKYFVPRIIDYFLDDDTIGMIGFVGTDELPEDGVMWNGKRYGCLIETHVHETVLSKNYKDQNNIDAVLCDGFILATSKNIAWREDLFDGWDFYDASQCMEYIRRGFRIIVPYQKEPWLLHDCGFLNLNNYEEYRKRFVKEYFQ